MQDPMEIVKEVINTFLNDRKEDKKQLVEQFLNNVMEEEARIQVSAKPYERSDKKRQTGIVQRRENSIPMKEFLNSTNHR